MSDHATSLWKVDPKQPEELALALAAQTIVRGDLVAFPTETVYGLGANALDPEAVIKIFEAKGRPSSDPLIVHLASRNDLSLVSSSQPKGAMELAERFWPGPLTLLLPKSDRIPPEVTANLRTVAVRVPAHPVALGLLRACGVPIAAPSANRFGHASPTTAQHVLDDLSGRIALVLDGGSTPLGVESTVLDLISQPPVILRPGGLPREEIEAVIGPVRIAQPGDQLSSSPGRQARHYAPRSRTILCTGDDLQEQMRTLAAIAEKAMASGRKVGVIAVSEGLRLMGSSDIETCDLGPASDLPQVARSLFAGLRSLESAQVDLVLAHTLPPEGLGLAINDRLARAADRVVSAADLDDALLSHLDRYLS
jgi:L-threonylcarbamoyladenylate synthase